MTLVLLGVDTAPGTRAIAPSSTEPGSGVMSFRCDQLPRRLSNLALSSFAAPEGQAAPGHDTSFENPLFADPLPRFSLTLKVESVGSCLTWSGRPSPLTSMKSIRVELTPQSAEPLKEDDALSFFVSPSPLDSVITCRPLELAATPACRETFTVFRISESPPMFRSMPSRVCENAETPSLYWTPPRVTESG